VQSALDSLRDVELFQGLDDAHRRAVAAVASERRSPSGPSIIPAAQSIQASTSSGTMSA